MQYSIEVRLINKVSVYYVINQSTGCFQSKWFKYDAAKQAARDLNRFALRGI